MKELGRKTEDVEHGLKSQRWAALLLALGCAFAQAQPTPTPSGIYSCTDGQGRKLTSDRPIAECLDREQKLLNPSGTVRARVGPVLTAQERAEAEEKEKQAAQAHARVLEERRRERALLIRFPSRQVHDKERAEQLAQIDLVLETAAKRSEDLRRDRRKIETEMEFYKKDPNKAPLSLRRQLEDVDKNAAEQARFMAEQQNEIRRINARFDEELDRLKELWFAQTRSRPANTSTKTRP